MNLEEKYKLRMNLEEEKYKLRRIKEALSSATTPEAARKLIAEFLSQKKNLVNCRFFKRKF